MFLHINSCEYLDNYRLKLGFNNGETKQVDLEKELYGEIFEPLKEKDFFKDFFISQNTIEWRNGADFAPEYLYKIGQN
ncbi:MAG: DUF2442 domain-containing protein [Arcobacter sp.]|nr:DUF2442 domain-containing protein [Arcobacter sp.]